MTWHTFGPWWFSNKSCPWTGPSPFQREMERIRIHRRGVGNFFRECNHYVTSRVLTTTPIPASSVSANTAPVQFVSYLSPFFFGVGGWISNTVLQDLVLRGAVASLVHAMVWSLGQISISEQSTIIKYIEKRIWRHVKGTIC